MDSALRRFGFGAVIGAVVSGFEAGGVSKAPLIKGAIVGGLANVVLNQFFDASYEGITTTASRTKVNFGAYAGPNLPQIDTAGDPYHQAAMAGWADEHFY